MASSPVLALTLSVRATIPFEMTKRVPSETEDGNTDDGGEGDTVTVDETLQPATNQSDASPWAPHHVLGAAAFTHDKAAATTRTRIVVS